jgi:hypothetical protein
MVHPNSYPGRWPTPVGPLRITLVPDFGTASLDGIWRPYSTDLLCEAPHLINQFPASRGRLDRMACSPTDWDEVEPFVFTTYGRIPVGKLPPEYLHIVLCRIFGGPIIRIGIQRDWDHAA